MKIDLSHEEIEVLNDLIDLYFEVEVENPGKETPEISRVLKEIKDKLLNSDNVQ